VKYLILVAIVVAVLFLAKLGRRNTRTDESGASNKPTAPPEKQALLACAHCGVHLPVNESLPGRGGVFCDEAHRSAFERAHPLE
jgi:uncharacterized protein